MKKTLLLFVAAVLALGLVISCAQPSSYEVTLKAGGGESIDPATIKAEQFHGFNLVTWTGINESRGYVIYRREIKESEPVDSTFKAVSGTIDNPSDSTSTVKKIPYYTDTGIADGVTYQYGIASVSHRSTYYTPAVSEIAWQEETDASKFVVGHKKLVNTPIAMPTPLPTVAVTQYNTASPASDSSNKNYKDAVQIDITAGLNMNYNYDIGYQYVTTASPDEDDWSIIYSLISSSQISSVNNYLDYGNVLSFSTYSGGSTPLSVGFSDNPDGTYTNRKVRFVVTVTAADDNEYIIVQNNPVDSSHNPYLDNTKVVVGSTISVETAN
jgi:hypothetical protein